jgi:hypothetical protein
MTVTNTQQKALAYFSERLQSVVEYLEVRNKVFENELNAETQRMAQDGTEFATITTILNVAQRNNLEQARMYYEYAENLSRYVYKLQHLDSSKAKEYLHRQSLEHRDLVKHYDARIKRLFKSGHSAMLANSLTDLIANKSACQKLADDFTTASQL